MKRMLTVFAGVLLLSAGAMAQEQSDRVDECQADADCPAQFVCATVQEPCDATPCACACPACDPAMTDGCGCVCPVCDVAECVPVEMKVCQWEPVRCGSDDDCTDGFECVAEEICSGGSDCACAPCACDPTADAACVCEPCDCPETTEPECTTGASYCLPARVACATDDDCADGFTCETFETGATCACVDCGCPACEGDACEPCECEPCDCGDIAVQSESYCLPAEWAGYVDLEDGAVNLEPRQDGDAYIAVGGDDDLAGETANPVNDTDDGDGNCSAGGTGSLSWILLLPFGILVIARRRTIRG